MSMFCYQCEQTSKGTGCTTGGVCGKDPQTAALQDLLFHVARGISVYADRAAQLGRRDPVIDRFVLEALFSTVTNVNFDPARLTALITRGAQLRDRAQQLLESAGTNGGRALETCTQADATMAIAHDLAGMVAQGQSLSIADRIQTLGQDVAGLQELIAYGLKGMAAYADHAAILGVEDAALYAFLHEALAYLAGNPTDVGGLTAMALRVGEINLKAMEMLDRANTAAYGHPEPTAVRVTPVKGKAIVVSGHDLRDLKMLLDQTAGKGINVYTHGEMLPALAYPELKRYPHLVGNYGGAWQDQRKEFALFPGAVLMTTNCIQRPADSYNGRIFTTGLVAWPGVTHIAADSHGHKDFGPLLEAALAAPGFEHDEPEERIMIGFARNSVLAVADQVIAAVKSGKIRRFFLIAGCDGAKPGRNYYTELAEAVPDDCVILTLACGKYRFNKLPFGDIGGIPRLLDCGQCNDAFSAIQIAVALAGAFDCSVNDLPLSFVLSWYEQKAVCILLTLLHLGIKNIRIGPSLPAFVGPNVLDVLVSNFGLKPTGTAADDLRDMLGS